jgi:hypothetical protein
MRTRFLVAVVLVGLLGGGVPLQGHHSFAAEFDVNKPITLKGTLTKMEWTNPHGWIHIDVRDPDGKVVSWAIETGVPNALLKRGLRRTDFPIGSELTIEGYRAKDGTAKANGVTVKFADGRNFFMGSSGTGAPVPPGADR